MTPADPTKEAPMGAVASVLADERRRLAELLEEAAPLIGQFVSTPVRAVEMAAWLIRGADDPVDPGTQDPPPLDPAMPELAAPAPAISRARRPSRKQVDQKPGVHVCDDCSRVFNNAQGLGRHRSTRHPALKIVEATPPAKRAAATVAKVDTTADRPPASRSTSAGVASMCLSGSHAICLATTCSCECHGGHGRSAAAS